MQGKFGEFIAQSNLSRSLTLYYGGWEHCQPSHAFGPAIRQHYLLHYIVSGKGSYYVHDKCYQLKQNEAFLICPGESTFYKADEDDPWEYCWISFDGYEAADILKRCGLSKSTLTFHDKSNGKLQDILLDLIYRYENFSKNEYSTLSQLYQCFSYMLEQVSYIHKKSAYVETAIDYIYHNYSYNIKITDIAKHVNLDRTYLYRLFKESCNVSPQQYLLQFRLQVAVNMLETTNINITEISYSCGFKDTPTFCKHFKKFYCDTPFRYRKKKHTALEMSKKA
jgi:AraC-like DNA-binding protein